MENASEKKHSICPLNIYFEGDENKCDVSRCDFTAEFRDCGKTCVKSDKVTPLAQYLEEYIGHELADNADDSWREFFERALTAYEDMQGVQIEIKRL